MAQLLASGDSRDSNNSGVLVTFEWAHDGASDVRITGDFLGWLGSGLPMQKAGDGGKTKWTLSLRLRPGSRVAYKYIVDSEWVYDPERPFAADEYGNINNYMEVPGDRATATNARRPSATLSAPSPGGSAGAGSAGSGHFAGTMPGFPPSASSALSPGNPAGGSTIAYGAGTPVGTTYAAKAVKEHREEFGIDVSSAAASGKVRAITMARSVSVSDVSSLNKEMITGTSGRLGGTNRFLGVSDLGVARRLERSAATTPRHSNSASSGLGLGQRSESTVSVAGGSTPAAGSSGSRPGTPGGSAFHGASGGGSADVGFLLASAPAGRPAGGTAVIEHGTAYELNGYNPSAAAYSDVSAAATAEGAILAGSPLVTARQVTEMDALSPLPEVAPGDETPLDGGTPLANRSSSADITISSASQAAAATAAQSSFIDHGSAPDEEDDDAEAAGLSLDEPVHAPHATRAHPPLHPPVTHHHQHAHTTDGSTGTGTLTPTTQAVYAASAQAQAAIQAALAKLQISAQATSPGAPSINLTINLPAGAQTLGSPLIPLSVPPSGSSSAPIHAGHGHAHTIAGGAGIASSSASGLASLSGVGGGHGTLPKSASGHSLTYAPTAGPPTPSGVSLSSSHGSSGHLQGIMASPNGAGHAHTVTLTNVQASLLREGKLVLAFVGAPAVGKTFMARRLKRHLSWIGYKAEIFNVGNYRRKLLGANQPAEFFNPANEKGEAARREMARVAFDDMCAALLSGVVDIAIFDATNTTLERRRWLKTSLKDQEAATGVKFQLVFIESVCTDEAIIRANVRETKLKSPDYKDMPEDVAVADFLARIRHYKSVYQPISEDLEGDLPYIKLVDVGRVLVANRINGYLNSRIMFFLSNLHITPRPIWLTRHGESEYNVQGRIGGDSLLSPRGHAYSHKLSSFMSKVYPRDKAELVVWTSSLKRTQMTAGPIGRDIVQWKALDEIDAGICDGMTYEAIAATMPEEYAARAKNKFTYRYPRGESYQDMITRLEPVIIELMRQKEPVLIVSHQATLRVLYAYLTDKPPEACPDILFPLHTIIQLTPKAYGCEEVRHELM